MPSAAGLSAAYGGYQKARQNDVAIESGDIANEQGRLAQRGQALAGEALPILQQMTMPGASPMPTGPAPQAPPPGQPSQPMQQGPQPQMLGGPPPLNDPTMSVAPSQQNAAPPGSVGDRFGGLPGGGGNPGSTPLPPPPVQGAPPAQQSPRPTQQTGGQPQPDQQTGRFNLPTIMAAVVKAGHAKGATPAEMMAAVTHLLPRATAQGQLDYKTLMAQLGAGRLNEATAHHTATEATGQQRADNQTTNVNSMVNTRAGNLELRGKGLDYRMVRDSLNRDVQYQRLEQAKQSAIERGDLAAARAAIDAAHKRALEYIATGRTATGTIDPADVPKIRAEADRAYNEEILKLSGRGRAASQGAAPKQAPAQPAAAAQAAPVKVSTPQEAQALQPGTPYVTPDGQMFTR